ncbi:hypothetical protein ILUMI_12890 [Ignelater luminosus]|uniref:Uncharacterized protein n=1 Tax=Ignelater luminosus TaxID=2038154 RepID=A0A8K0GBX2_IGNLU|nr:hypothetical protein ILUMI_12890 [Ignelater luminosus]
MKNLSATLTAKRKLHLRKADAFFDLKRRYKANAKAGEIECLTFDFMQNLPIFQIIQHFMLASYGIMCLEFIIWEAKKRQFSPTTKAREKPSPFVVVRLTQESFFNIKAATEKYFLKLAKPSIKIKSIRQLQIEAGVPTVSVRDSYNGYRRSSIIRNKVKLLTEMSLKSSYEASVEIFPLKINIVKTLITYLEKPEHKHFYEKIFFKNDQVKAEATIEVDEDDNSSGCEEF